MSVISLLVIEPGRLPTLEAMQDEATRGGDPIDFIEPADMTKHTGFLPVRVKGRDTGFEYYFDAVPDGALPTEALTFGSHHIITRTGSSFEEGRAAMMFLMVAARLTDGAYVYPDDAIVIPPQDVQSYLHEEIKGYDKYIK